MAENEVSKSEEAPVAEAAPLTREELAAKLEQIAARARAAGMSPLQMMARQYAERGMKVIDGFLSTLESLEQDAPKKLPPEDAPAKKKD